MSDLALQTTGLGKMYRIGGERSARGTLMEAVTNAAKRPIERVRHPGAATHSSEELWALRDVDLEIRQGEVLGIIGRNGSGKSTLLKILSHITDPTEGSVRIKGRVASLLEVGTGFHAELTGRENIFLNGAILGMTRAEMKAKFDDIVEFAGTGRFLDTPVKRYSSGMYVRLAFAVAAHLDPEILVIDEVLAVGDADFQRKCLGRMQEAAQEGRTVLFVSHNMGAISRLCSSALLLDGGRVRARGDVHEVTSLYLHGGDLSPATREWQDPASSPGDGVARLNKVRVLQDNEPAPTVDIRLPVTIEMEYTCLREGSHLVPIFSLFNDEGQCLFVSADFRPGRLSTSTAAGSHLCRCTIPGNTLAEATVLVVAEVSTGYPSYAIHFLEWDVVSFQVVDHGEPGSVRNGWSRPLLGAMRPECTWEFEFTGAASLTNDAARSARDTLEWEGTQTCPQ